MPRGDGGLARRVDGVSPGIIKRRKSRNQRTSCWEYPGYRSEEHSEIGEPGRRPS